MDCDKRKLCPYEKFLWFPDRKPLNFNVTIHSEVEGRLELEHLYEALRKVEAKHSYLSVRVKGRTSPYFQKVGTSSLPLRIVHQQKKLNLKAQIKKELHTPFDLKNHSLVRVVLLHGPQNDHVIITGDHLIVDGIGLVSLLNEILNHTLGKKKIYARKTKHKPIQASVSDRIKKNRKPYFQPKTYQLDKSYLKDVTEFSGNVSEITSTGFVSKKLSQSETGKLIQACKANNVSIQSALFTASIMALESKIRKEQKTLKPIPIQYECPVNLRPFLRKDRSQSQLSCSIGILNFELEKKPNEDFWVIANKTKAALNKAVKPGFERSILSQMEKISNEVDSFNQLRSLRSWKGPMVGVSNLGIICDDAHPRIKSFSVFGNLYGTFYSENNLYLVVCTFKNQLDINLLYPEPLMTEEQAKNLLDVMLKIIAQETTIPQVYSKISSFS